MVENLPTVHSMLAFEHPRMDPWLEGGDAHLNVALLQCEYYGTMTTAQDSLALPEKRQLFSKMFLSQAGLLSLSYYYRCTRPEKILMVPVYPKPASTLPPMIYQDHLKEREFENEELRVQPLG